MINIIDQFVSMKKLKNGKETIALDLCPVRNFYRIILSSNDSGYIACNLLREEYFPHLSFFLPPFSLSLFPSFSLTEHTSYIKLVLETKQL